MKLSIAERFSDTPWGRYPEDGEFCGQNFRENLLAPALREGSVTVDLDGVEGFGSSFLDEAFGGLVRKNYFSAKELRAKLEISCSQHEFEIYRNIIWKYIEDAKPASPNNLTAA